MSADNWSTCPRCRIMANELQKENERAMRNGYGNVSPQEYEDLREVVNLGIKLEETLREDWDLGIDIGGTFYVRYHAHCDTCGFDYKFNKDEMLKI